VGTGRLRAGRGRLNLWNARSSPLEKLLGTSFPATDDQTFFAPCALSLFSSNGNQAPDHAAVILQPNRREADYRLRILRIDQDGLPLVRDLPLWQGGKLPVLATAATGRYLALAGNNRHEILVYALADLLDAS